MLYILSFFMTATKAFSQAYHALVKRPEGILYLILLGIVYAIALFVPAIALYMMGIFTMTGGMLTGAGLGAMALVGIGLLIIWMLILSGFYSAMSYKIGLDTLDSVKLNLGRLFDFGKRKWLKFTLLEILYLLIMGVLIAIFYVLLVVPTGIIEGATPDALIWIGIALAILVFLVVYLLLYFSYNFLTTENIGPVQALSRSYRFVSSNMGKSIKYFILVFIAAIVYAVIITVIGMIPCVGSIVNIVAGSAFSLFLYMTAFAFIRLLGPKRMMAAKPASKPAKKPAAKKRPMPKKKPRRK